MTNRKARFLEAFLRGCGVPEQFIAYIGSMVGHPIEYYSCFIGYSHKDEEFAKRLHNDLQGAGIRCWFAPHDIKGGRKIHEQIDEAIRLHDKLMLILSEYSMASAFRDADAAKRLFRKALGDRSHPQPRVINTDLAPILQVRDPRQ